MMRTMLAWSEILKSVARPWGGVGHQIGWLNSSVTASGGTVQFSSWAVKPSECSICNVRSSMLLEMSSMSVALWGWEGSGFSNMAGGGSLFRLVNDLVRCGW